MRKIGFFAILLVVAIVTGWIILADRSNEDTISYTRFLQRVQAGQVAEVKIQSRDREASRATVRLKDGETDHTILPPDYSAALKVLQYNFVNIEIQDAGSDPYRIAINSMPFFILLGFWIFAMMRLRAR
jgi:ATP-dependent Zn protease